MSEDNPSIYTHPHIRELAHKQLLDRLQNIRDRRLVAALQYVASEREKNLKMGTKLHQQWLIQGEKNRVKLAKIDDMIDQVDKAIRKQVEISHNLALVEEI